MGQLTGQRPTEIGVDMSDSSEGEAPAKPPSTPFVEEMYVQGCKNEKGPHHSWPIDSRPEFRRWLAEHDREVAERTWDLCLDTIEAFELNTAQSREGNPYRDTKTGADQ